eukprot:SAG11_NODE_858_length_6850_cov_11.886535_8_plen_147_part_00
MLAAYASNASKAALQSTADECQPALSDGKAIADALLKHEPDAQSLKARGGHTTRLSRLEEVQSSRFRAHGAAAEGAVAVPCVGEVVQLRLQGRELRALVRQALRVQSFILEYRHSSDPIEILTPRLVLALVVYVIAYGVSVWALRM